MSHRACQKFVHTNFVSLQLNKNLYNKLQYSLTSSRMWINLWMFFTMNVLWFFISRTFMQGFVTWSCTNDLQLLRKSDHFNFSSLRAFDCLDTCTASGLLFHLERLVSNKLPELSIYKAQENVFEKSSISFSFKFEFEIKDNLSLIWFNFDLIWFNLIWIE